MQLVLQGGGEASDLASERLGHIYARESHRLVSLGRILTGSSAAGEDLAHEVFVRALRKSARDPSYLREPAWPWLRAALMRLAMQRRRQMARELGRLARHYRSPTAEPWSEGTTAFVTALQTLPPRMRACVALFYGEDLSTAQVAQTLGCSQRTVENQLRTARPRLARLLNSQGDPE